MRGSPVTFACHFTSIYFSYINFSYINTCHPSSPNTCIPSLLEYNKTVTTRRQSHHIVALAHLQICRCQGYVLRSYSQMSQSDLGQASLPSASMSGTYESTMATNGAAAYPECAAYQEVNLIDLSPEPGGFVSVNQANALLEHVTETDPKESTWSTASDSTTSSILDEDMDEYMPLVCFTMKPAKVESHIQLAKRYNMTVLEYGNSLPFHRRRIAALGNADDALEMNANLHDHRRLFIDAEKLRRIRAHYDHLGMWEETAPHLDVSGAEGPEQERRLAQIEGRECPVCNLGFNHPCETKCTHIFCQECIESWLEQDESCPSCRAKAILDDLVFLEGFVGKGYEDVFGLFEDIKD